MRCNWKPKARDPLVQRGAHHDDHGDRWWWPKWEHPHCTMWSKNFQISFKQPFQFRILILLSYGIFYYTQCGYSTWAGQGGNQLPTWPLTIFHHADQLTCFLWHPKDQSQGPGPIYDKVLITRFFWKQYSHGNIGVLFEGRLLIKITQIFLNSKRKKILQDFHKNPIGNNQFYLVSAVFVTVTTIIVIVTTINRPQRVVVFQFWVGREVNLKVEQSSTLGYSLGPDHNHRHRHRHRHLEPIESSIPFPSFPIYCTKAPTIRLTPERITRTHSGWRQLWW